MVYCTIKYSADDLARLIKISIQHIVPIRSYQHVQSIFLDYIVSDRRCLSSLQCLSIHLVYGIGVKKIDKQARKSRLSE